jgi:hypothetical protein
MSEPRSPSPQPSDPAPKKWKEIFEQHIAWVMLSVLISGAIGAIGFQRFMKSEIAERVGTEVDSKIKNALETAFIPAGAFLLSSTACPKNGWDDVTASFDGRYLFIDNRVASGALPGEGDGSHQHEGGMHPHNIVTGSSSPLGGGERSGNKEQRDSAHKDNVVSFRGSAFPEGSAHIHTGGAHQHRYIAMRLCKKT